MTSRAARHGGRLGAGPAYDGAGRLAWDDGLVSTAEPRRFGVVVPVKPPGQAKSRLAPLGERLRQRLTTAFALDTVAAALACPEVALVLVVTDDLELAGRLRALGAEPIPDGRPGDLNSSLWQGAAELHRRRPDLRLAGLCGDLPCLRAGELAAVLHRAAGVDGSAFLADAAGVGTTLYAAPDLAAFLPAFGPGSRAAHLALGAVDLGSDAPTVSQDVDTPDDLVRARVLGPGPATSAVLADRADEAGAVRG